MLETEMQWLMLQQEKPDDYVIATGVQHTVREFVNITANLLGFELKWKGRGVKEIGYINEKFSKKIKIIIRISSKYFRPVEVENLLGSSKKANTNLGWNVKISFEEMVKDMVNSDLIIANKEKLNNK